MFNGIHDRDKRKILILFLYAGVALMVYLFMRYVFYLAAPFVVALILACVMNRPVTWLQKRCRLPRAAGGLLVMLVAAFLAVTGIGYVGYFAIGELKVFLGNYGSYADQLNQETLILCEQIDHGLGLESGSVYEFVDGNVGSAFEKTIENIAAFVLGCSVSVTKTVVLWLAAIFIAVTAAVFLIHDFEKIERGYRKGSYSRELNICFGKMLQFGVVFVRTQLLIMMITMTVCIIGLSILRNPYAVLLGILIGILDALPVFGTGTVFIPWTLIDLLLGRFTEAAVIFSIYLICYSIREVLEPKLMGSDMGIHPVIMLMAMYAGVVLFGVSGFILGPAAYILITEIMDYVKKVL